MSDSQTEQSTHHSGIRSGAGHVAYCNLCGIPKYPCALHEDAVRILREHRETQEHQLQLSCYQTSGKREGSR
jgi:hypothetical protein